jgi:hypothetical protein
MKVLLFLLFLSTHITYAKVLLRTEAQVKDHVITTREIKIHELLNPLLTGKIENFENDSPLEQIIKEWLLYIEASTFYNTKILNKDIESKASALKKNITLQAKLNELSVTEQEIKDKIKRTLEADRLYTFKKKASVLPVPLSEIESEYSQNRIRYGNLNFEEAKNQIRNNKIQENLLSRLIQWFSILEKKYKVQRFSNSIVEIK